MNHSYLTNTIQTQFTLSPSINVASGHSELPNAVLLVAIYANNQLSDAAKAIDSVSHGALSKALTVGGFNGLKGQDQILYQVKGTHADAIVLLGCGEREHYTLNTLSHIAKKAAKLLKHYQFTTATSLLDCDMNGGVQRLVMSITDELYCFESYKSEQSNYHLNRLIIQTTQSEQELTYGVARSNGRDFAKSLANMPGNDCTPTYLAEQSLLLSQHSDHLTVEVLEEEAMEKLGMGSFLSVSRGSQQPAKMILLNYQGGAKESPPIVLVGKGITFDSGGISLKPGLNMDEMKFDMGGAASALGTMHALCAMNLPINVIVVIAAAENMPSGLATRPGDIVTSMSGKTIEILNTDAEGRLVLCDALTYVERYNPKIVIDIATLTGACIVALGHHTSGMLSNNDTLAEVLNEAAEQADDDIWRLPMNKKYEKQLKSQFADIGNIGGKGAGTITAACFLAQFTQNYQWAHLDIAGTAWQGKSATGRPVPLLTQLLLNQS